MKLKSTVAILLIVLASLAVCLPGCNSGKPKNQPQPVPVIVAISIKKSVPISLKMIGVAEAQNTVSVKSQMTGPITNVFFKDGQDVKKGERLIELDCRPVESSLKQAEANLLKDVASLENAKKEHDRYTKLLEKKYVARQDYDKVETNLEALNATIKADNAVIESNRIMKQYCVIFSPIEGRIGALKIFPGNIVRANETEIVTINQIVPINVSFTVPEKELPDIRKLQSQKHLMINVQIPGDNTPEKGELNFIDNAINNMTGTITLKGIIPNSAKRVIPGQFVNVELFLGTVNDATVVPSQSVEQGQVGQFVYVVKPDMKVDFRPVVTGATVDGETIITSGLKPGETIVTDGQLRLKPGAGVRIIEPAVAKKKGGQI
jgi:membrane fusion protein, multidrug efflux system